jgi:ATP-dependent RNA helicase DHX57
MPKNSHLPPGASSGKKSTASQASASETTATGGNNKKGKGGGKSNEPEKSSSVNLVKGQKSKSTPGQKTSENAATDAPKKPDTRTLIGGASWTGKLPVNLLSEHCQKQKWDKPEYTMTRIPEGFVSNVILSSKNPKSREITTLPALEIPRPKRGEVAEPTAVEARHFAAAYALFRVSSMKNIHMMMPPKYKDLWKGLFSELKKEDITQGRAWMYEADPFAALKAREEAESARAKKREEEERLKAKQQETSGLSVSAPKSRAWERAPGVEMGKKMRLDAESLIRNFDIWNSHNVKMEDKTKGSIVEELSKLGFRGTHVEEAADICKDREEVLEWLLIHVPEDDLPKWALPENYIAGVSMASSDLKKEAVIKRLASAGYAADLCEEMLNQYQGDELQAARELQTQLLQVTTHNTPFPAAIEDHTAWKEEIEVLGSIYDGRCASNGADSVQIELHQELVNTPVSVQLLRPPTSYPQELPILTVQADLPAYIRLSISKQALLQAWESFRGEPMIFNLVDWLEQNIARIIADPGRLSSVSSASVAGKSQPRRLELRSKPPPKPLNSIINSFESQKIREEWRAKEQSAELKKMLAGRQSLPAWQARDQIVSLVKNNRITIISGETGSGKSTQSVQFVLDDLIERGLGAAANIICTQPRRISALGLADRVAEERGGNVGHEVGYIIRGDAKTRHGVTRITFVTTGVLLRRLQTSGGSEKDIVTALTDVSHIVIDEVHERSVDADFLLVLLKRILRVRKDLKVILMSATADADAFEKYFEEVGSVGRVHISGRTFPVTDYYKDDIIRLTRYRPMDVENDEPMQVDEKFVSAALRATGMGIDYELIAKTVDMIDKNLGDTEGGVLIFLPGMMEIDRTIQALRHNSRLHPLPLHASLPPVEQRRVFPSAPKGLRKVIAATNVAETSITIPDIVAVIDSGRVKETAFDLVTSTQKLVEAWASRASCAQRRGRAGRVQEGVCYKLFTRNMEGNMRERPDPEILRVPLEQLCLSVKAMGVQDVSAFLRSALTPPSSQAVESALQLLARIGAVEATGHLTALGKHLAMIPADLKSAKLLVLGCTFGCADACLSIAALLASRSPFFNPRDNRDEVKKIRYDFAPGQGDLLSDLRAYETWAEKKKTLSSRDLRHWCSDHFLSSQTLRDVESNRAQLIGALQDTGFLPLSYSRSGEDSRNLNTHNTNDALLRALIASALHPQLLRIDFPATKFAASHTGSIALDPEARTIKFFTASGSRAFVHPSSVCFDAGRGWSSDVRFLAAWERFESGEGSGRKNWARGVSPCNVYSVLLFGGQLALDTAGRGIVVDEWIRVRGWARIGVLVGRLRGLLDRVLERKVDDPMGRLSDEEQRVLDVVRRLVERDGLDR